MADLNFAPLHEQVLRLPTIQAGMDAIFAAHAATLKAAVADAIANTQAADKATLDTVTVAAQAAIDAETATLQGETDGLASDIVANTPAAPVPPAV